MTISLANAPVSYGVFEMSVGTDRFLGAADRLLDEVAGAGYSGIDLGPVGYLGRGSALTEALQRRGLGLAGGYIDLPFSDPELLQAALGRLDEMLDVFDAAPSSAGHPAARPTLAASASEGHRLRPGAAARDTSIGLDAAGWLRFGEGLRRVVERCRERGYEPTFHHHAATWVEAPREIERMLELSDVGLCLDTGHLIVGGGDPVAAIATWAGRINQVHLKDVRGDVLAQIVATGAPADEIWKRRAFCPIGAGVLDVRGVLDGLRSIGYDGWAVVEQDVFAEASADFERAVGDQQANISALRTAGL